MLNLGGGGGANIVYYGRFKNSQLFLIVLDRSIRSEIFHDTKYFRRTSEGELAYFLTSSSLYGHFAPVT